MTMLQWIPPYDAWIYFALVAVCAGLLWLAGRLATSPTAQSWWLVTFRAAVLGLLLLRS